jgi:hypothetical protein
MFFIQYELRPKPDSEQFSTVGGAVANCFIDAESAAKAEELALLNFAENGWDVVSVEDGPMAITRENLEEPEWLGWYDQAATDGECYVFHQWPPGPQEDDEIH